MPRTKARDASKGKLYKLNFYQVIDGWAKARCAQLYQQRRISESELIEEILLKEIMPVHPLARKLVIERLFVEGGGTRALLLDVFDKASYDINVPDNLLPLAEFARQQELDSHTKLTDENGNLLPEMAAPFAELTDAIHGMLCELEDNITKLQEDTNYRSELQFARELLDVLDDNPHEVMLFNFYNLVVKHWDRISNRRKFNVIALLVKVSNCWRDAPIYAEKRAELLDVLKKVSAEWADNAFSI